MKKLISFVWLLFFCACYSDNGVKDFDAGSYDLNSIAEMDSEKFWSIIDQINAARLPEAEQETAIELVLGGLGTDELYAFQQTLHTEYVQLYRWDLWGAAYVIQGGCSDDGFAYFRYWLISQGQNALDAATKDPEWLAIHIRTQGTTEIELEAFASIGWDIWLARTGREWTNIPKHLHRHPSAPIGVPFDEDEAALRSRYPILWSYFGENPL